LGTERQKGSHSMAGYHSFELCYLAAVYTNLLITKEPLELHFKPRPDADRTLRVAPDLLPQGSIHIESVTLDGKPHQEFDAAALTITLPHSADPIRVKVRIVPKEGMEHFSIDLSGNRMSLSGDLDPRAVSYFRTRLASAVADNPDSLVLDLSGLQAMCKPAVRALMLERGKMNTNGVLTVSGANESVKAMFEADELSEEISLA
jgi:ABC-type transporter Mla MlaB component